MSDIVFSVVNAVIVVLLAPLFEGIVRKIVARLQGRYGPPITQPYSDLAKLFNRIVLTRPYSVWDTLYTAAPLIIFASIVTVAALVPTIAAKPLTLSDLLVIFYMMGMARFVYSIASFNVVNPYAVVSSAREHLLTLGVEPAALLAAIIVALTASSPSIAGIAASMQTAISESHLYIIIPAMLGFITALLADLALPPFDVAEAEQEISEGLMAEYSGPHLALLKLAFNCKRLVLLNILFALFLPFGIAKPPLTLAGLAIALVAYLLKIVGTAIILALIVTVAARLKIHDIINYLTYSLAFSIVAAITYISTL